MEDRSSARSRELGARIRAARNALGWSANQLAKAIGWSQAKASRMETGMRSTDVVDVAYQLGFSQIPLVERDMILELMKEQVDGCWVRPNQGKLPEAVPSLVFQQDDAASITCYDPCGIPPMLQTGEYAEAELFRCFTSEAAVMPHVRDRLGRHGLLHGQNGPDALFYLHETALRSMPVEVDARAGQLLVLLMLIGGRTRIRVIPASQEHARIAVGPFQLLRFCAFSPIICVPTQTVSLVLEGPEHLEKYGAVLTELDAAALSDQESRDLIQTLANEVQEVAPLIGATDDEDELETLIGAQEARERIREAG